MLTKKIFQIVFVLMLAYITYEEMGCKVKQVIDDNNFVLRESSYADYKYAYHGVSSCAALSSDDGTCCYMKVKFKNEVADEKFTHRGCIQITFDQWAKIDSYITELENNIASYNKDNNITKVDVDIDCNSKFIKLTGLILLAFLL